MLGSHALHISRRGTSEVDEQSVPLASSLAGNSTKPAAFFGNKKEKQVGRGSLVDNAFARAVPEEVQLRAIAEVTENPRRASIAIRRQSLIQILQNEDAGDQSREPFRSARGSISGLIPGPPPASTRISAFPGNVYSIAEQGTMKALLAVHDADDSFTCGNEEQAPVSVACHMQQRCVQYEEVPESDCCMLQGAVVAACSQTDKDGGAAHMTGEVAWCAHAPLCLLTHDCSLASSWYPAM